MSATTLAVWIDRLRPLGVFVAEAADTVSVSNLNARIAVQLVNRVNAEGWGALIYDQTGAAWPLDDVHEDLAPFRVVVRKPPAPAGCVRLLTDSAFREWLLHEADASWCQVARLSGAFDTQAVRFTPWTAAGDDFLAADQTASPRSLVRDHSRNPAAPLDIRPWLLSDVEVAYYDNSSFRIWMSQATKNIFYSLPDEIDSVLGALKFKGPPRLTLEVSPEPLTSVNELQPQGFKDLQRATRWVFDNAREAEMRHVLLATEIARSGVSSSSAGLYLREHIAAALDGAKIGYQASLSQLSADTLKALADLRKAVTEETAKVTEATRQISGAVAAALAIGVGLMAARVTSSASSTLIAAVMVVAAAYVGMVVLSGVQFARLQKGLRKGWQPRLYRYLPPSEYETLVLSPTRKAETALFWVSGIGATAVLVIATLVLFPSLWR